jgi:hypothetical protein
LRRSLFREFEPLQAGVKHVIPFHIDSRNGFARGDLVEGAAKRSDNQATKRKLSAFA